MKPVQTRHATFFKKSLSRRRPVQRPYPTPAQKQLYGPVLWAEAAKDAGYSPFPQSSGNLSHAYTNPDGVTLGPCTYCGFCERFGCGNYSKASPQTTLLPVLTQRNNFELRIECEVTHINTDGTGKRATGATYVDSAGREWEQPAELVFLCAFQMFNVQLLLLSRIGQPYDITTGKGVIGRNYSYQVTSNVETFFDNKIFNSFIASGAIGMCIDEFNGGIGAGSGWEAGESPDAGQAVMLSGMPFKHNAARRHRIPKARYRVRNWPAYEAGLKRRGDLTLWLDETALAGWPGLRMKDAGEDLLHGSVIPCGHFATPLEAGF